jgi:hypothetical protein
MQNHRNASGFLLYSVVCIPPKCLNRVGGGVAPAVLPHHRTYGSVYGGSQSALKVPELVG